MLDFGNYVFKHPEIIPFSKKTTPHIVVGSANEPGITRENLEIAYKGMKRSRSPYFQAIKYARKWKLVEIKRPMTKRQAIDAVHQAEREVRSGKILRGNLDKLAKKLV